MSVIKFLHKFNNKCKIIESNVNSDTEKNNSKTNDDKNSSFYYN
jgi:hypothetical protein